MLNRKKRATIAALLLVSILSFAGCKTEKPKPENPYSATQITEFVDDWASSIPDRVMEGAKFGSPTSILKDILQNNAKKKTAAMPTKPGDPMKTPDYDDIENRVYREREYKLGLVTKKGLTDAGKAVIAALENAPGEGYDADFFDLTKLKPQIDEMNELVSKTNMDDFVLNDDEIAWAKSQLKDKKPSEFKLDEAAKRKLEEDFLAQKSERLKGILAKSQENAKKLNQLSAEVEAALAHLYLRYAFNERFQHVRSIFIHPREDDFYNDPETRTTRPDEAKGHYRAGEIWRTAAAFADSVRDETKIATGRLSDNLTLLLTSTEPAKVVDALQPQEPQYKKLISELVRYNEIVENGGWKKINSSATLRKGSSGEVVLALKKRLAAEGYDVDTASNKFDDKMLTAVETYQKTHQYNVNGVVTRSLWGSINVSAKDRRDQIILNLKRWRRSSVRPEKDSIFVLVNIPDFMLELWDGGERKMRFAVVVGNNQSEIDEESKKKIWKNRTPVPLAAYIDRVIYNPFWNVTPRIREDEILPQVQKEIQEEYDALNEKYRAAMGLPPLHPQEVAVAGSPVGEPADGGAAAPPPTALPGDDGASADANVAPPRPQPNPALAAKLKDQIDNFPYFNKETGEIDVSKTDKDHVPKWYAANNYEVVWMGPNFEYVRMTQGPHNALGKVKVIFPNYYDVYLHDTPAKLKFQANLRAFSHGCIRMEKPLEFAKYLLDREGKYESEHVDRLLASGKYRPIFFDRKIPIFLEYYSVRVDDNGRANFLADPYDFDAHGIVIPTPPDPRSSEP